MWKYSTCRERIIILQKRHNCLTKGKKNVVGDICLLGKFNTTNPTSCNVLNQMKLSEISIFKTYYTRGYFKCLWQRKIICAIFILLSQVMFHVNYVRANSPKLFFFNSIVVYWFFTINYGIYAQTKQKLFVVQKKRCLILYCRLQLIQIWEKVLRGALSL